MKKINDILRRVASLERYQGLLGQARRNAERQIIIGAVNTIVGTLERQRIEIDTGAAFDAINNGIQRAEEHFKAACEADKMLPFASQLPGDAPKFVDSLAISLKIAGGKFLQEVYAKIAAEAEAANAKAQAATIAAAAALPADPPAPAPEVKPLPDASKYFAEMRAVVGGDNV